MKTKSCAAADVRAGPRWIRRSNSLLSLVLGLMLLAVAGCGGSSNGSGEKDSDGLQTVRIGSQKITADAGLFIADEMGFFEDEGIKVTYKRLDDASAITNALATGQLEVAGATITPGTFQATAQDLGIKIVGDKNFMRPATDGSEALSGTRMGVLPEYDKGNIKDTLEALRGKKLAIHSDLSIQIVYLSALLEKYGFSLDDFDITPVLSPNQPAALSNGSIQAAVMLEPFFTQSVNRGIVKPASDMTDALPKDGVSTTAVLYGHEFIEDQETAQGFMNAYMKGVRLYNDAMFYGKNKKKVINIIAENTGLPPKEIAKTNPPGLDPDQEIQPDWIQQCEDFYLDQDSLDTEVDPADMVDTSFRDKAIEKLGEYEPPNA